LREEEERKEKQKKAAEDKEARLRALATMEAEKEERRAFEKSEALRVAAEVGGHGGGGCHGGGGGWGGGLAGATWMLVLSSRCLGCNPRSMSLALGHCDDHNIRVYI